MRDYMISFFDEYDFPQEAREELLKSFDVMWSNDNVRNVFENYIEEYAKTDKLDWHKATDDIIEAGCKLGIHEYSSHLIFLICLTKHVKKLYEKRGIAYEVYKETFNDLKCKLFECYNVYGVWGNAIVKIWYGRFFELKLFAFGRFQYEEREFIEENDYVKDGKRIQKNDLVINIHIPSNGVSITNEIIDDSFAKAYEFYKDLFEDKIVPFTLRSWLLYPRHREFLPEESNILNLFDYFDVVFWAENHWGDWWRIFHREYNDNIDEMPTDTSLQRAYVGWVKKGNTPGCGRGIMLYKPDKVM